MYIDKFIIFHLIFFCVVMTDLPKRSQKGALKIKGAVANSPEINRW